MTGDETWSTFTETAGEDEFKQFLDAGGDPNYVHSTFKRSMLHQACEHGNLELISIIILAGASPDLVPPCGYPAIFQALDADIDGSIQNNWPIDLKTVKHLIECGVSIDCRDESGKTPREYAASYGSLAQDAYDDILESVITRNQSKG